MSSFKPFVSQAVQWIFDAAGAINTINDVYQEIGEKNIINIPKEDYTVEETPAIAEGTK